MISSRKVPTLLLFWERSAIKNEDQALVWGKAHGLLTDANAGETVTRADMVRALYQIWGITMVEIHAYSKAASGASSSPPISRCGSLRVETGLTRCWWLPGW